MELTLLGIIIGLLLATFVYFGTKSVVKDEINFNKTKEKLFPKQAIIIETKTPLEKFEEMTKNE